ncbi:uncharacterized protein LOC117263338 [Epinephelus lanceolatus]|uniref:histone-lysine N-methyltransferase SETDB1-A n=1 Tax=Epinephelus lanceolatus TaxID=310571 RepID=UPI0014461866|nr:histone-lysine N-methyltransferase SETDB1-A [Epinephelus lanceolatus]
MEGEEMEMSKEELQRWLRQRIKKNELITSDVLEKCKLLQSVLERRERQAALLLKLCKSVSACESVVKTLYSLLGWEYKETDSHNEENTSDCGNTVPNSPSPPDPTPKLQDSEKLHGDERKKFCTPELQGSENLCEDNGKKISICLFRKRKPVVALTRLSESEIQSLLHPAPQSRDGEDESLHNSDSDMQWEPGDDSSDSDYSISSTNSRPSKRRKMDQKNKKLVKTHASPEASTNSNAKSNKTKTSAHQASASTDAKVNVKKTSPPQESASTNANVSVTKTSTPPANSKEVYPVIVSTLCQSSDGDTKTPPKGPLGELVVNMNVMARKSPMSWRPGKIVEIITMEDGRLKYKINFEEKGKSRVSGHHIAFDYMPNVDQLFVGARVVVKRKVEERHFSPGIMAELPSRKNRMRFLVFTDDHKPLYVGLPLLRLVSRPLEDPLDDIPDGNHKDFMRRYMEAWPYPPLTQYRVGQTVNAELDGVLQRCEVLVVDCSLMEILVAADQHKEWIYRGSTCLQHIFNMNKILEVKKGEKQKNKSLTVKESSKSAC